MQKSLIPAIQMVASEMNRQLDSQLKEIRLTQTQALVLLAIFSESSSSSIGPSRIASALGLTRSRVSQVLTELQDLNLLTRESLKADSRRLNIQLTKSGSRKSIEALGILNDVDTRLEASFSRQNLTAFNKSLREASVLLRRSH